MDTRRHFRTAGHLLWSRIDPWFYKPEFLKADVLLHRFRSAGIATLPIEAIGSVDYGFMPLENYWPEDRGAPFLRVTNIKDNLELGLSNIEYVNPISSADPEYRLAAGDVLIVQCGNSTGRVAYIPKVVEGWVFPSFALRIRLADSARVSWDPAYIATFLSSELGQLQVQRTISITSVRPNTTKPAIESIQVLNFASAAQRYIGDKVRQAERLRERARRLEAESSAFLQLPEWTEPRAGTRRAYTARRGAMRAERLDAPFYDPGHEDFDALLRRRGDIELCEVASLVEVRWTRRGEKFSYFEIGELDIASGVLSPTTTEVAAAPSRAQILVEPWDVLVSTVRPNRKNVGLVLPSDDGLALVASTGFAVLRFENAETAAFYHSFLRSDAATQQLMRWNSGGTYPAIESDVPLRVRAPRFDDDVVEREGRRWLTKFSALSASRRLTLVATTLVEQLIDGRMTEAELVGAQKALDADNRGADREILRGLRQSNAPDAKPLIADVDALYALLDIEASDSKETAR